jgi:hypothetical protein
MNVKIIDIKGTWRGVADAARTTINMEEGQKEPSSLWKKNMLLAEHSPIRKIHVNWKWYDLLSWVSVHMVRHKIGIEHWVRSQRTDRTGVNRNDLKQSELIEHECEADAQAIINISRKRLCQQASLETRLAWYDFLNNLYKQQPELVGVCVPECIYRGFCPELKSCGYYKTNQYKAELREYRKGINE